MDKDNNAASSRWRAFVVFILMVAAALGAGGFWVQHFGDIDRANEQVIKESDRYVREAFASFETTTLADPGKDEEPRPKKIWRGATAKVIAIVPSHVNRAMLGVETRWTVYAQTPKGAFFAATYTLNKGADSSAKGAARLEPSWSGFNPVSEKQLKNVLYTQGLLDTYRALFGEPAPPVEVDA